jgi:DNA-directed RNA polymerase specialized sigma24 family protein
MHRDLILRARNGDHDAFTALAADAFDRLHRTARLILRSDDLAADAVQEALVSAWLHIRASAIPIASTAGSIGSSFAPATERHGETEGTASSRSE